jgi:sorbitol-specific phosphotransferase system component IIC
MARKNIERKEGWMRIPIFVVSGILLSLWKCLICILTIIHWFIVVIGGKRIRSIAKFSEMFNTQVYIFLRYVTFVTNRRPFPFENLTPNLSQFER